MKLTDREKQILQHINRYCEEIEQTIQVFNNSEEEFYNNFIFRNAVCMSMLQIGELVKNLSFEFRKEHDSVDWRGFTGIRDMFAHSYLKIKPQIIWEATKCEVVELHEYCKKLLLNFDE